MKRCGGEGGERPDLVHDGAEADVVAGQPEDRGLRAQGIQVGGVHLQHAPGFLQRLVPVALEEPQAGQQRAGPGQVGVGGERRTDCCLGGVAPAFEPGHAGQAQQRPRVGGVLGEDVLEGGGGLASVVALQEEFGDGELGGVVERPGGNGLVQGPERVVRVFVVPAGEVDQRPAHRRQLGGREAARAVVVVDEPVENAAGGAAIAVAVLEDSQLDPGRRTRPAGFTRPGFECGPGLGDAPHLHERGP